MKYTFVLCISNSHLYKLFERGDFQFYIEQRACRDEAEGGGDGDAVVDNSRGSGAAPVGQQRYPRENQDSREG